jgi:hypothetical protein
MKKIKVLILLFVLYSSGIAGKYAGSFLELGVGARALGMGSAYVALSDDAYGFYWNPSGMAFLTNFQVASMYADLFNSFEKQNFLSAAMPVFGGVTISLAWMRRSIDDIPRYRDFINGPTAPQRYEGNNPLIEGPINYFSSNSDAFVVSFSKYQRIMLDLGWQYFEFPVDFGYGANIKVINEKLDDKSGTGIGLDLGMILKIGLNNVFNDENYGDLIIGLNVQDIADTKITWDTDSKRKDYIERNFKYGVAYIQPLNFVNSQMTIAYDIDSRYEGADHFGTELLYDSMLALRFGLNDGDFTTGAGFNFWKLKFDYAYQSHDLGNTHRVSVLFNL